MFNSSVIFRPEFQRFVQIQFFLFNQNYVGEAVYQRLSVFHNHAFEPIPPETTPSIVTFVVKPSMTSFTFCLHSHPLRVACYFVITYRCEIDTGEK